MEFTNLFYTLITYYIVLTNTKCRSMIITDVANNTIDEPHTLTEENLPTNKSNVSSESMDIRKKLQIEFNEILKTHKNDLRKSITESKPRRNTRVDDTPDNIVKKLDENSKSLLKALLKIQNDSRPVQPTPQKSIFVTTLWPKRLSNLSKHLVPISMKPSSRELSLKSLIKAELQRNDEEAREEQTTVQTVLRTKEDLDFRVKPKFMNKTTKKVVRPQLLNAEILDMAPAKGARVHKMRFKNRLCHRHVLHPEGPKYDDRGRAYMSGHQAFEARIGKEYRFEQTLRPEFMLPSCCNCCKKSVLGCE